MRKIFCDICGSEKTLEKSSEWTTQDHFGDLIPFDIIDACHLCSSAIKEVIKEVIEKRRDKP